MLFRSFFRFFIDASVARKNSAGEIKQKQMALTNHLIPFFGAIEMANIGKREVRAYIKEKKAEEYADKTINNHLIVLSRFLMLAREEMQCIAAPFKIELIPLEWSEATYLDAEGCQAIMAASTNDFNPIIKPLVIVALNTGMRIGELLALDWAEVSLHAQKLVVAKSLCRVSGKLKSPKNKKRRDITLNEAARTALKSLPHREGRVFNISYSVAYDAIMRVSERAGYEHVGWHTLRHTFASLLVMSGIPIAVVSQLLGHSSVRMTEKYAHLFFKTNKDAVGCLADAMKT